MWLIIGTWMKANLFLNEKHTLSYSIKSPERWKSHFRALQFQHFLREHAPRPPRGTGFIAPCWYSRAYIQTCWLLQSLLKPLHFRSPPSVFYMFRWWGQDKEKWAGKTPPYFFPTFWLCPPHYTTIWTPGTS